MVDWKQCLRLREFIENLGKSVMTRTLVEQIRILRERYSGEYEELAERTLYIIEKLGYNASKSVTFILGIMSQNLIVF